MSLKIISPHLSYYIERLFKGIPEILEKSFEFTMEHGGNLELDFQRPEGQSYNPRPARIALIGIKDENIKDLESIQLLLLSSLLENGVYLKSVGTNLIIDQISVLSPQRLNLLATYCDETELDCSMLTEEDLKIVLALHVDRMRHSHQGTFDDIKLLYKNSKIYLNDSKANSLNLHHIITNWCHKMERQFPNKLT